MAERAMAAAAVPPAPKADPAPRTRRRRRTRAEVEQRIISVAREMFCQRGYAAATTREIARVADVSETLLFRYFGGKAQLFDAVVSTPFNVLMANFIAEQHAPGDAAPGKGDAHRMFAAVIELFENNRELLTAAQFCRDACQDAMLPGAGLSPFFEASARSQRANNGDADPAIDLNIAVRLAFGMVASAVLMRDWLFAGEEFDREAVMATLETMTMKALGPA